MKNENNQAHAAPTAPADDSLTPQSLNLLRKGLRDWETPENRYAAQRVLDAIEAASPASVAAHADDVRELADANAVVSPIVRVEHLDDDVTRTTYRLCTCGGQSPATSEGETSTADAKDAGQTLYTCIGKGGNYELIGHVAGAGPLKGSWMVVYRDASTGDLYFRSPGDFDKRMQRIDPAAIAASQNGGA